jgi:hypothetical protein
MMPVKDNHMIEQFSPAAANPSLYDTVWQCRCRCRDDLVYTQTFNPPRNALIVYAIAVSNQITRSSIKQKRFDDLLRRPLRRWMFHHVEVNNSPSGVGKHDKDEPHPKSSSRDGEKVDRY